MRFGFGWKFRKLLMRTFAVACLGPLAAHSTENAHPPEELSLHEDSIDALCGAGNYIYTASFDGTIKKTDFKEVEIVGRHEDWVRSILCIGDTLVSSSNDGRIIVWEGSSILREVDAHNWWITKLAFYNDKIISVSLDETVKIWSYPELGLLYEHKIPGSNKHHTLAISNSKAFIGSTGSVSVLDLEKYRWIVVNRSFQNYNAILSATASDQFVYLADSAGNIYQMNPGNVKSRTVLSLEKYAIKAIALHDGALFVGNDNGRIYRVELPEFNRPVLVSEQKQPVRAILIRGRVLYAAYDEGLLRSIDI